MMPWPTLISMIMCWVGVILSCAAGHEAVVTSVRLLRSVAVPGFVLRFVVDESLLWLVTYATIGGAGFMFMLTTRHLASGRAAVRMVKTDVSMGVTASVRNRFEAIILLLLTLATTLFWVILATAVGILTAFFLMLLIQCSRNDDLRYGSPTCLDFSMTGLVFNITSDESYGRLCGDDKREFCDSFAFQLTCTLYIVAFGGILLTITSLIFLMVITSTNYTYLKKIPEFARYFEDDEDNKE